MQTNIKTVYLILIGLLLMAHITYGQLSDFETQVDTVNQPVPWTQNPFYNDPNTFRFAIISDRTGGHRDGVFGKGVSKLNMVLPEFVISIGDMIEGGTSDLETIHTEWQEFDSILSPLKMKYFYLPGNHDLTNPVMTEDWKKRFGPTYYHFKYKNVLFLALNTMDTFAEIGDEQVSYINQVLEENQDVRWTFVFMHHPLWHYHSINGFDKIEELLQDRKYTVIAGHRHRYLQEVRRGSNYMVLGTTGGGSRLRGPKMGEFDHITWVTVDDKGPTIVNMALDGLLAPEIASRPDQAKISALSAALSFRKSVLYSKAQNKGKVILGISNSGPDTLYFDGQLFHHHQLDFEQSQFKEAFAPNSQNQIVLNWTKSDTKIDYDSLLDIDLFYTIGYKTDKLDLPFELRGTKSFSFSSDKNLIRFSSPHIFLEEESITLQSKFEEASIHYTTDGSEPDENAPVYSSPIEIDESTTVKARFITDQGFRSQVYSESYVKASFIKPVKVKAKLQEGLRYDFFEGPFDSVEDYAELEAVRSGTIKDFNVTEIRDPVNNKFGVSFKGYIKVDKDGFYCFKTTSNDGSKLLIHDQVVVDNDGIHGEVSEMGYIPLKKGLHPITVKFIGKRFEEVLRCAYRVGKEGEFKPIDEQMLLYAK